MKPFNKIIVVQYEDGELSDHWCIENRTNLKSIEYLHKENLLDWLKEKRDESGTRDELFDPTAILEYDIYQQIIDKINSL